MTKIKACDWTQPWTGYSPPDNPARMVELHAQHPKGRAQERERKEIRQF